MRNVKFDGAEITLILAFICILLFANTIRVVNKGRDNYEVFLYEANLLNEIQAEHEDLQLDYEFYRSEEAMRLLGRDVLGLAAQNETLYTTRSESVFFEEDIQLLDLQEKEEFGDWWDIILPFL